MDAFDLENEGRELERRVARELGPAPAARPAFRASLRERFAAAPGTRETSETGGSGASRESGEGRSRSGPMIEDALRNLSVEPAQPDFRARLREEFVSVSRPARLRAVGGSEAPPAPGAASSTGAGGGSGPRPLRDAHPDRAPRSAGTPREISSGPFSWQVGVGLLAAAAAVMILVLGPGGSGRPGTSDGAQVAQGPVDEAPAARPLQLVSFDASMQIDGEPVGTVERAAAEERLCSARSVECTAESAELMMHERVRVQLASETRITLPEEGIGEPDAKRDVELTLEHGSMRFHSNSLAEGARLVVQTPHARVRISGELIGIEVYDHGTCICVAQGDVRVEVLSAERQTIQVEDDSTCFVFGDPAMEPKLGPSAKMVGPDHIAPLMDFYAERQF